MPRVIHFEIHADKPERAMRFYHSVFGWDSTPLKNMPVDYSGSSGPANPTNPA